MDAREAAIRLLARREHSARELWRKLTERGLAAEVIGPTLAALAAEGLQSDARFAAEYLRSRAERGYGPLRIRAELAERGVAGSEIATALGEAEADWAVRACEVHRRRFGDGRPVDRRERARQMRFLQQRGFDGEQIRAALGTH